MSDAWVEDDELPAEWARDAHALTRIADEARAGLPAADLALRLIRDRKLAAAIAEEASPGADRVALAVGDRPEPPHVIIGRGGGYVATLLGPKMNPYPTPVVGFDRVRLGGSLDRGT